MMAARSLLSPSRFARTGRRPRPGAVPPPARWRPAKRSRFFPTGRPRRTAATVFFRLFPVTAQIPGRDQVTQSNAGSEMVRSGTWRAGHSRSSPQYPGAAEDRATRRACAGDRAGGAARSGQDLPIEQRGGRVVPSCSHTGGHGAGDTVAPGRITDALAGRGRPAGREVRSSGVRAAGHPGQSGNRWRRSAGTGRVEIRSRSSPVQKLVHERREVILRMNPA